jgi:AcrR family transcriptional regulator
MTSGLRERRKQETRLAISDTATRMFAEAGFDAVTITQVADAAGVAKMTVTNYFPRKEDLVFDRAEQIVAGLADAIAARAPGESLLTAVRRDYAQAVARREVTLGLSGAHFARMVDSSPVLQARLREILDQRERALAGAIVAETGSDDVLARVAAAALASVHRVLYAEASRRSLAGESREQIAGVLAAAAERAFDLLEPSLGGYRRREADGGGPDVPSGS